jgi:CPA1 family monovalent cation:H+ antiporter
MNESALIVLGVTGLLGLVSLLLPFARRVNLPYTVLLALLGVGLGALAVDADGAQSAAMSFFQSLRAFGLTDDGLLNLFLPPLLFAAGLNIDVRRLMDDFAPIVLLAVVAVVVCTLIVGVTLTAFSGHGLLVTLLIGAIIATTDTAAVVAIFRDIGAPRRLSILVEGESLFNDAAAIAIFAILTQLIMGASAPTPLDVAADLFLGLVGGAAVGFLLAQGSIYLMGMLRDAVLTQVTLTVSLAYVSYLACDALLGVSGVIAVVTAALVIGSGGRTMVSVEAWQSLKTTWAQLDFWSTSLIFVLAAMFVPDALAAAHPTDLAAILVLVLATLVARGVIVFGVMPLLSRLGMSQPLTGAYQTVLWWGALRGAVTVALALAAANDPALSEDSQRFVLVMSTGFVLFTLFVKAPTLRPLMRALALDQLSPKERLIRDRVIALSRAAVGERVARLADDIGIQAPGSENVIPDATPEAITASAAIETSAEERFELGLLTIATRESQLSYDLYDRGILDRRMVEIMRAQGGRILDGVKSSGVDGYRSAAETAVRPKNALHRALWIYRKTGFAQLLSAQLADRFEELLISGVMLRQLLDYNERQVAELVGRSTTSEIAGILAERIEATDRAREALELQYPAYAADLRSRYVDRIALDLEESEYRSRFEQSLISGEVFEALEGQRQAKRRALGNRPPMDLGLKLTQMLSKVPLFSSLDDAGLRNLARRLRPYFAVPSEAIIGEGEIGKQMYFIASGSVEVDRGGNRTTLNEGDFFGEMALLNDSPRNADVCCQGYCNLLSLSRNDFEQLVKQYPKMRADIAKTARQRTGLNPNASLGKQDA